MPTVSRPLGAALAGCLLLSGCVLDPDRADPITGSTASTLPASTRPALNPPASSPPAPSTDPTEAEPTDDEAASTTDPWSGEVGGLRCRRLDLTSDGDVERAELVETSGLAAGTTTSGIGDDSETILWAHNDSGQEAGVFAVDLEGRDRGFFALARDGVPVAAADVEDIALVDGVLYLADIGDNDTARPSVTVFLVTEPTPGADGDPATDGTAEVVGEVEVVYPDGPTDAEAIVVDPLTGDLLILTKDLGHPTDPTRLYTITDAQLHGATTSGAAGSEVVATAVGSLDVVALTQSSPTVSLGSVLFPGAVTAADISSDGTLIAIRTYASVWLFDRQPGQTMAEALAGVPCEGGSAAERQGEALTLLPTVAGQPRVSYATISEGANRPVNIVTVELDR